ncbi:MAG TPA: fatty acid desaturase, partial [Trinickia sp.]|nr:fatty acid desaturase [Trinickia sp.]
MWNYARFYLMYPLLIATFAGIYAGGPWMWTGTAVLFVLAVGGDFALPEDLGGWRPAHPLLVDAALYGTFPFIVALVVALLWRAVDPAAVPAAGAALQALVAWRASPPASALDVFGGALSTSLLIGIAATNVAHELMHRRGVAGPLMAKALLVFSFDLPLVTSHLYGHHIRVGTRADHTTARRGESSFRFIARSTLCGNLNAWRIECERLRNQGRAPAGPANRWLRGHALALACVGAAGLIAGPWGAALFFACALAAKSILELINYIQHYGLIRV